MMPSSRAPIFAAVACLLVLGAGSAAFAVDQPISGSKLQLKTSGKLSSVKRQLLFVSKDPGFLFPDIGGNDDPQQLGAFIDIVGLPHRGGITTFSLPAGVGKPGWTAKEGDHPSYRFDNGDAPSGISPVRIAQLKEGKQIKILIKTFPLNLENFLDGIAIRIRIGTLQSCALFGPATILRHDTRQFLAMNAPANALGDCSDASIGLGCDGSDTCGGPCPLDEQCAAQFPNGCMCVSPHAPCGDTSPVCNGTCAAGEECAVIGDGYPACMCIPAGATPCGNPGAPACGGVCPSGRVCRAMYEYPGFGGALGCTCAPPGACGTFTPGFQEPARDCGPGSACGWVQEPPFLPPGGYRCKPITCDGTYPTCGGACEEGGVCEPVYIPDQSSGYCACAAPGPCDAAHAQ
jgi:hypothetical protein